MSGDADVPGMGELQLQPGTSPRVSPVSVDAGEVVIDGVGSPLTSPDHASALHTTFSHQNVIQALTDEEAADIRTDYTVLSIERFDMEAIFLWWIIIGFLTCLCSIALIMHIKIVVLAWWLSTLIGWLCFFGIRQSNTRVSSSHRKAALVFLIVGSRWTFQELMWGQSWTLIHIWPVIIDTLMLPIFIGLTYNGFYDQ